MFEQLLCKQVTVKLDRIFSSLSTAYRKGHSCETTLLRLNEDWKLAIDRKELVCILSTDMSKAFDSHSHSPTLTKLEAYGFESSASKQTERTLCQDTNKKIKARNIKKHSDTRKTTASILTTSYWTRQGTSTVTF